MKINRIALTLFIVLLNVSAVIAQTNSSPLKKEKFHFDKVSEDEVGYAMAVKVGNTIYISGYNSGGDPATQINNVYEGLLKVLESYGLTYEHVVKENLYAMILKA